MHEPDDNTRDACCWIFLALRYPRNLKNVYNIIRKNPKKSDTRKIAVNILNCEWCEPRHDKTNNVAVRPAKIQISLGIRPVWSESSLCT